MSHPRFFVGSVLLVFLVFCVMLLVLFVFVLCLAYNVIYLSELFIIDCPFCFIARNCLLLTAPSVLSLGIVYYWLPLLFYLSELLIIDCPFCFIARNCLLLTAPSVFSCIYFMNKTICVLISIRKMRSVNL
jgi:hypothetical protein